MVNKYPHDSFENATQTTLGETKTQKVVYLTVFLARKFSTAPSDTLFFFFIRLRSAYKIKSSLSLSAFKEVPTKQPITVNIWRTERELGV